MNFQKPKFNFAKTYFTTGDVAKICKVAPRTVSKWFDAGVLPGYKLPGSGDRRFTRAQLLQFMRQHNLPTDMMEDCFFKLLAIGLEAPLVSCLQELLPESDGYTIRQAATGFEAGLVSPSLQPHAIVIDLSLGRAEARCMAQGLRSQHETALLVALANEDETELEALKTLMFDEAFKKPVNLGLLVASIGAFRKKLTA